MLQFLAYRFTNLLKLCYEAQTTDEQNKLKSSLKKTKTN